MWVWVAGEMCKGCREDVQGLPGRFAKVAMDMCKEAKVKSTSSPRPKNGVCQIKKIVFRQCMDSTPLINGKIPA